MGGMLVLEWAFCGADYVRTIVPIATSSRHSAWGISWGEAQRQSIYCDPKYEDGYYTFDDPPISGLGAARMSALLTYRSRDSFESRFGRNTPNLLQRQKINDSRPVAKTAEAEAAPGGTASSHWSIHNDGHRSSGRSAALTNGSKLGEAGMATPQSDPQFHGPSSITPSNISTSAADGKRAPTYFSAQSYLRYQGAKVRSPLR